MIAITLLFYRETKKTLVLVDFSRFGTTPYGAPAMVVYLELEHEYEIKGIEALQSLDFGMIPRTLLSEVQKLLVALLKRYTIEDLKKEVQTYLEGFEDDRVVDYYNFDSSTIPDWLNRMYKTVPADHVIP